MFGARMRAFPEVQRHERIILCLGFWKAFTGRLAHGKRGLGSKSYIQHWTVIYCKISL